MSRFLQVGALVVFVAVLMVLLTPADDGPVMELRGQQIGVAILFALLALATRVNIVSAQSESVPALVCSGAECSCGRSPCVIAPLLC